MKGDQATVISKAISKKWVLKLRVMKLGCLANSQVHVDAAEQVGKHDWSGSMIE